MVYDINPSFGEDERYESSARRVTDLLWENSKGNPQDIPDNYVRGLGHEYADGSVSLLNLLNKVSLSEGTYSEFSEVVDRLIHTQIDEWPNEDSILEIQSDKLLYELEEEPFEFGEFDWDFSSPSDMSGKIELFLKKVISSVYLDGVSRVTDKEGNPPNLANNYLMAPGSKSFSGTFYDSSDPKNKKQFDFEIKQNGDGEWEIQY